MKKAYCALCLLLLSLGDALAQEANTVQAPEESPCTDMQIFDIVEEESVPVGGLLAFYQSLGENFIYPKEAVKLGIEGTTYVRFVINVEGDVICTEVVEGYNTGYGLDEEAMRVVKLTKWQPGKQRGVPVNQRKILPFKFKIPNPQPEKKKN